MASPRIPFISSSPSRQHEDDLRRKALDDPFNLEDEPIIAENLGAGQPVDLLAEIRKLQELNAQLSIENEELKNQNTDLWEEVEQQNEFQNTEMVDLQQQLVASENRADQLEKKIQNEMAQSEEAASIQRENEAQIRGHLEHVVNQNHALWGQVKDLERRLAEQEKNHVIEKNAWEAAQGLAMLAAPPVQAVTTASIGTSPGLPSRRSLPVPNESTLANRVNKALESIATETTNKPKQRRRRSGQIPVFQGRRTSKKPPPSGGMALQKVPSSASEATDTGMNVSDAAIAVAASPDRTGAGAEAINSETVVVAGRQRSRLPRSLYQPTKASQAKWADRKQSAQKAAKPPVPPRKTKKAAGKRTSNQFQPAASVQPVSSIQEPGPIVRTPDPLKWAVVPDISGHQSGNQLFWYEPEGGAAVSRQRRKWEEPHSSLSITSILSEQFEDDDDVATPTNSPAAWIARSAPRRWLRSAEVSTSPFVYSTPQPQNNADPFDDSTPTNAPATASKFNFDTVVPRRQLMSYPYYSGQPAARRNTFY